MRFSVLKPVLAWAVTTALFVGPSVISTDVALAEPPSSEEESSKDAEGKKSVEKQIQIKVVSDGDYSEIAKKVRSQLEAADVPEETIEKALAALKESGQVRIVNKDIKTAEEGSADLLTEHLKNVQSEIEKIELSIVDNEGITEALERVGKLRIIADVPDLSGVHSRMAELIKQQQEAISELNGAKNVFQWKGKFELDNGAILDMLKTKGVDDDALAQLESVLGKLDEGDASDQKFRIGISLRIEDDDEDKSVIAVESVFDDSPAFKAGLKKGDVIVKAGEIDIEDAGQLLAVIQKSGSAGENLPMVVDRDGGKITVEITPENESDVLSKAPESLLKRIRKMTPGADYAFVVDGDKTAIELQSKTEDSPEGEMDGFRKEVDQLKKDVSEIKSMLKELLDK